MRPRFPFTGQARRVPGFGLPLDDVRSDSPVWRADRACCCPAQPVVRAIMPPTYGRPPSVDLLLCGHHYRVSRRALAAGRARIENLPGKDDAVAAALLEPVHRDRAAIM